MFLILVNILKKKQTNKDLFGKGFIGELTPNVGALGDEFILRPFSVLDAKSGPWVRRKRAWINKMEIYCDKRL